MLGSIYKFSLSTPGRKSPHGPQNAGESETVEMLGFREA